MTLPRLLLLILLFPALAWAQTVPTIPRSAVNAAGQAVSSAADVEGVFGSKQDVGGDVSTQHATSVGGVTNLIAAWFGLTRLIVNSNAALKATSGGYAKVDRAGFTTPGDGGAATYNWSSSACAISGGDNGSQVAPTTGAGCWIADFSGIQITPMVWGAAGDGVTNDSAAVQAAMTAMAGGTLYTGPHSYNLVTGIVMPNFTQLVCPNNAARSGTTFDFVAGSINTNMVTLGESAYLGHCSFNAGAPGTSTVGAAINMANNADTVVDNVYISGGCIGIDVGGNNNTIHGNNYLGHQQGAACGGIRVGHLTTGSLSTDIRIEDTIVQETSATQYGMKVEDAGGLLLSGDDMLGAQIGTWIVPGLNQWVAWLSAANTYMGDTGAGRGIVFDTADATGRITGAQITAGWASNNVSYNVDIENTAGGTLQGIHFVGMRSYLGGGGANIFINAGTDVTIDDSHVCGAGASETGIYVNTGVSYGAIRNTTVSGSCDHFTATSAVDITFVGGNQDWIVTGNDLESATQFLNGAPTANAIVANNIPLDNTIPTVASAAAISPAGWSALAISGTTTITTINQPWNERKLTLIPTAAVPLNTGGNICNALTATAGVPILLTYTGTCWAAK